MKEINNDELLEQAIDVLKVGGEIFWYDEGVKHTHSLKKPHPVLPFGCNGQCCKQDEFDSNDH